MSVKKTSEEELTDATEAQVLENAEVAPVQPEKVERKGPVIYIGPTIPGVVRNNQVFSAGLPDALRKKTAEIPAIGGLIIDVEKLGAADLQLRTKDTTLSIYYHKVKQCIGVKEGE